MFQSLGAMNPFISDATEITGSPSPAAEDHCCAKATPKAPAWNTLGVFENGVPSGYLT